MIIQWDLPIIPDFVRVQLILFTGMTLKKNRPTNLKVHPLIFMDVTFRLYLNATPDECLEIIERICQKMLTTGGGI